MKEDLLSQIDCYIEDKKDRIIEKTVEFIRIPSVSGSEGEMARYLTGMLGESGFDSFIDRVGNVVARIPPSKECYRQGLTVLLNVHLDTVPPGSALLWTHDPYGGDVGEGKIFGRGASDTKGAWAPMVVAMEALRDLRVPLSGQVVFSASVMEEMTCSFGTRWLIEETLKERSPDYVILGEPTNLKVAVGHKGRVELEITSTGVACHASVPENGDNALYRAAPVIRSLERFAGRLASAVPDPLFGQPTLAVTNISVNPGVHNVVPDLCTLFVDYRFLPGETVAGILSSLEDHLKNDGLHQQVKIRNTTEKTWTGVGYTGSKQMTAFDMEMDHPLVRAASDAVASSLPGVPEIFRWNFATDGGWTRGVRGIPTIGFSPCDQLLAHVVDEYVEIDAMVSAARVYARIILNLLGEPLNHR